MPRNFSLARLMLGVTLLCVIFGLAVSYRDDALVYALIVAALVPSGIVCLTLVSFASQRTFILFASLVGMALGLTCLVPVQHGGGPYPSVWHAIGPVFMPIAIGSTIGAFFFGTAALVINGLDIDRHAH
jgi:hypothetical protein